MVCRHVNVLRNQQIQAKAETIVPSSRVEELRSDLSCSSTIIQHGLAQLEHSEPHPSGDMRIRTPFPRNPRRSRQACHQWLSPQHRLPRTRGRIGTSPPDVLGVRRPLVQYYDDEARGQVHIVADRHVREFHGTCGC
jgi:hypothetical protein